eukprot:scaffold322635_cov18-Tisochrysis_lutea.AAC.1
MHARMHAHADQRRLGGVQSLHHLPHGHLGHRGHRANYHHAALLLAGPRQPQALAHLSMGPGRLVCGVHGRVSGRVRHVCER